MDARLKDLSYSSFLTLHTCGRKFQLYRLQGKEIDRDGDVVTKESVTFAFGKAVGEGIQEILRTGSIDAAIWAMFLIWDCDLAAIHEKQNKSFYLAVYAVQKFAAMHKMGILKDYELVWYQNKPATELDFLINFPDGFRYRGSVDAVLKHRITGKILVLETKTTSMNQVDVAMYKNSAQAIGYSIVLDVLFPELSSYEVLYLAYLTKSMEYAEPLQFSKSYLQRALWIQEVLLDIEIIKLYDNANVFSMHGESCYNWYKQCEYFGICTLATTNLTKPETPESEKARLGKQYQITLTLQDLIDAQVRKSTVLAPANHEESKVQSEYQLEEL